MTRIKRGLMGKKSHKKLFKQVKGFRGSRKHRVKLAKEAILKAGTYSYRDRRTKKREFRRIWITQINAALKEYDIKYSEFINGLKKAKIELDRKILADLAKNNHEEFQKIINKVRTILKK
ncbi:MAG: 50S ribosomal protein L20 [Candidatus Berkelbacteria bacterium]|nr:50S ribosomal protein L20 [Candidatus Berkelbacteria bacterium]